MLNMLALAVLPALILLFYTFMQDKMQREPFKMIVKGFLFGILSVFVSFVISIPLQRLGLFGDDPYSLQTFGEAVRMAFLGAAVPEETAKLLCLWLFLRKNRFFDERMDGIVYAVCVGMGFAGFENVGYVFGSPDWITVGITRSLTSIPGHFGFAVLMGYFFSLYWFDSYRAPGAGLKMWLYPVLAHGIYDTVAMSATVSPEISGVVTISILLFCFMMVKWARKSMKKHLIADSSDFGDVDVQM